MPIHQGTLVPGTLLAHSEGTRQAHTCALDIQGAKQRAYIKPLNDQQRIAECFCAVLLQSWGLNVPDPVLVEVNGEPWFGCLDTGYPDIKRHFGIRPGLPQQEHDARAYAAALLVCSFPATPRAIACDEAIANGDRNLGNILWNGVDVAWIDHERALHLPDWQDANLLAAMAGMASNTEEIQRGAVAAALTLAYDAINAAEEALPAAAEFANQVKLRMRALGGKILNRFPTPENDLFSPTNNTE